MAAKLKSRRRRRVQEELVFYEVLVTDWDYYYSISPNDARYRFGPGPYWEIQVVKFQGSISRPEGFKYPTCEVTLSGREGMQDEKFETPPKTIGGLSAHEDTLNAYVFIPCERVAEIVEIASTGRIKQISITGSRLKWRSGTVRDISVSTKIEEE